MAFDAAYQGESGGQPRYLEDPHQRVEDFKCAVTYLSLLGDDIDPERIGIVGICASGGYSMFAAQTDVRIKAVAGVVPMCNGAMVRAALQDEAGEIRSETLFAALQPAGRERLNEAKGAEGATISVLDAEEAREYYCTDLGYHPGCANKQLVRSTDLLANYDSFAYIKWISPRPILFIIGTEPMKAFDTFPFARSAYGKANEPKDLFVVDGMNHLDFYHKTDQSIPKLVAFFEASLG